ncbi:eukaryotic translation initiation factor 2A [Dacryopinax primogenitus]|uniref:Eukaryotic translation initiation factor 2A n=1 Tax=Dacryopinax primogenitus (strain DJM 731) TaxID=1858805 RepID=M5G6P0_DACPD|nr:eukaryotic translation initiation factor 2A [Dacryopinax primogenitus]EJU05921.1 eukaryotic translation initiation factor 2A [Dacryopinax primogenitus]
MAAPFVNQIAFRAQKTMGMLGGSPTYNELENFPKPEGTSRMFQYTQDGRFFAHALPKCVRILHAETLLPLRELPIENVIELNLSPLGNYLSTWERPLTFEDGRQHKNLRVWNVTTGEEAIALTQKTLEGWDLQYTSAETHAVRQVGQEVQVFSPSDWGRGVVDKLRIEGMKTVTLSPGPNPSIAVFIGEKKGAPASVRIYSLLTLASPPSSQKTFYKADRIVVKWNKLGTHVLFQTQTEVDQTNKSYYGESNLYMLAAAGTFDCRVTLDKEGPIHDFTWSPNSKEFLVIYGYMPAKATLFDQRVNPIHNFPTGPRNFVAFNPQGRLIAVAGFGNLSGSIDIYDRRTLNKVCLIEAPNTSWCEWSPDGLFLLTAVLSPRLRVDNGIKIWHCTGTMLHVFNQDELYQTTWKPALITDVPEISQSLPTCPIPSASVIQTTAASPPPKAVGAYRPPGARGTATPDVYKREDEGGAVYISGSGTTTPTKQGYPANGHTGTNGYTNRGRGYRYVPGAPAQPVEEKEKPTRRRKANKKKDTNGTELPVSVDGQVNGNTTRPPAEILSKLSIDPNPSTAEGNSPMEPFTPGGEGLDPVAKKIRSLNKKLKAIEELKEKAKRGEKMEITQLRKLEGEADVRKELNALTANA